MGLKEIAVLLALAVATGALAPGLVKGRWPEPVAATAAPSPAPSTEAGTVALHAADHGHFYADAVIEGRSLRMVVDTGASLCALSEEEAERLGIRLRASDFTREVATANGPVRVAPVRLARVQIGPIVVRDVEAVVVPRGRLGTGLLGMSFLKRLRDFSIAGGRLTLRG